MAEPTAPAVSDAAKERQKNLRLMSKIVDDFKSLKRINDRAWVLSELRVADQEMLSERRTDIFEPGPASQVGEGPGIGGSQIVGRL